MNKKVFLSETLTYCIEPIQKRLDGIPRWWRRSEMGLVPWYGARICRWAGPCWRMLYHLTPHLAAETYHILSNFGYRLIPSPDIMMID